jgi:acyl carrier protein
MEEPDMTDIAEQLKALVADHMEIDPEELVPTASFIGDLGADSLDVLEMVMALEETFEIEISDADVETMRTLVDAEAYVRQRLDNDRHPVESA